MASNLVFLILQAAFEYDAYNYEFWLARKFDLSDVYRANVRRERDNFFWGKHERLLKDQDFLDELNKVFGYNPFKHDQY